MEVVKKLELSLIPEFEEISRIFAARHKEYRFRVFSDSGGDDTPHPWHVLGVECLLHEDLYKPPNTVSIKIDAVSLQTETEIWAGVVWEYSEAPPEGCLSNHAILFSDQTIETIKRALPGLGEVFESTIKGWKENSTNESASPRKTT